MVESEGPSAGDRGTAAAASSKTPPRWRSVTCLLLVPNLCTAARACLGAALLLTSAPALLHPVALGGAAVSDALDGASARALGALSRFGAAFDLFADGLFFLGADIALWRKGLLPGLWLVLILVAAVPQILSQVLLYTRGSGAGSLGFRIDKVLGAYSYLFVFALAVGVRPSLLCLGQVSLQVAANGGDLLAVLRRRERRI